MKKLTLILCLLSSLMVSAFAQTVMAPAASHSIISWVSKDTTDEVTINNGTSAPINVTITVADTSLDKSKKSPGVSVTNCGSTTHIESGSSAVCNSTDAKNPVKFSSDSPTDPATGTYEIKQQ